MKFGIHHSSWLDTPDPAEAFGAVKSKAQWAEDRGFVWFSVMDHMQPWVLACDAAAVAAKRERLVARTLPDGRLLGPAQETAGVEEDLSWVS